MNYYLDTNICIYFLKALYPNIADKLKQISPLNIKVPSIVKAELLFGAKKSIMSKYNLERINLFLEPFEIVEFGDRASHIYSDIRFRTENSGRTVGPNDLIIASTVLAGNGILVTNNVKEFQNIDGLNIENWAVFE
ncbi:MAG: type II toxin-antitoxin system VapC family toxin [Candidatus Delongbacteria bacterium]|nr:type II toxin-antitoxin system VapC family toxin [Candidatus Delongbacteria bacterium]MCG2761317.1 type II toxin-antitoxin system VapC family toxin [Candidatus Delongbacteria bacterium]